MFDYLLENDSCYVALDMLMPYHLFLLHALSLHIRISQLINQWNTAPQNLFSLYNKENCLSAFNIEAAMCSNELHWENIL